MGGGVEEHLLEDLRKCGIRQDFQAFGIVRQFDAGKVHHALRITDRAIQIDPYGRIHADVAIVFHEEDGLAESVHGRKNR